MSSSGGWRKAKLVKAFSRGKKLPPPSTKQDDRPDVDEVITMTLCGNEMRFENGVWKMAEDKKAASLSNEAADKLNKRIEELEGENRLLKYKVELLVDMLTLANLDYKDCERELNAATATNTSDKGR